MKADMKALAYPLPEDIAKRKWSGDLDGAARIIEQRLAGPLPQALRARLELERETLPLLRASYCVSQQEALDLLQRNLRDFQPQELAQWRDDDWVDWMVIDGQIYYISSFYNNLIKTRPELEARHIVTSAPTGRSSAEIRDEAIAFMQAHNGAAARIRIRATAALTAPEAGRTVRAWLPLPVERDQVRQVRLLAASQPPKYCADAAYPQRTVYFEAEEGQTDRFWIEYEQISCLRYLQPDPAQVSPEQPAFYTQEEAHHIVFTPYLRALTAEVVGEERNPLLAARRIYDFITTQVTYSYVRPYAALPNIPEYCASRLRGDCGVQALTFITMCRIAGIPARWQSGMHADETGTGCHDWCMFYVAPYGWMFCDPSYGGGAWEAGAKARWDHYFCNLDPYRVVLATEFQTHFDPPKTYSRHDPYDNQDGEMEYADGPIARPGLDLQAQCLSVELLDPEQV